MWVYQIPNYKWVELPTLNTPTPRCRFAFTSYSEGTNEYFVVFGGALSSGVDNNLYM